MAEQIFDFSLTTLSGKEDTMANYSGKVLLIVNVASKCGFTPQYEGLEALYEKYKEKGLVIMGFPANNFMRQEPGNDQSIAEFCRLTYGVTFPMFSKVSVKGRDIAPLYEFLVDKKRFPQTGGNIKWNFTKFLVGKKGEILQRFEPKVTPESREMIEAIEAALSS